MKAGELGLAGRASPGSALPAFTPHWAVLGPPPPPRALGRGVGTQLVHRPQQRHPGCASVHEEIRPSAQESVPEVSQPPRRPPAPLLGTQAPLLPCSSGSGLGWGPSYLHQGRAQPKDAHGQQVLLEPHLHGLITRLEEESASRGRRGRPFAPRGLGRGWPEGTDSPLSTRCRVRAARSSR